MQLVMLVAALPRRPAPETPHPVSSLDQIIDIFWVFDPDALGPNTVNDMSGTYSLGLRQDETLLTFKLLDDSCSDRFEGLDGWGEWRRGKTTAALRLSSRRPAPRS